MNRSKNKNRHKWVDEGGKESPIYSYTCSKCGLKKLKCSSFHHSYYDNNMVWLSNKAPECVEQVK